MAKVEILQLDDCNMSKEEIAIGKARSDGWLEGLKHIVNLMITEEDYHKCHNFYMDYERRWNRLKDEIGSRCYINWPEIN